jgi:hypothetical protein
LLLGVASLAAAQIGNDDDDDDWHEWRSPAPSSSPPPPPPPPWVVMLGAVVAAATVYICTYRDTRKYKVLSDELITGAWWGSYTEHYRQHNMQLHLSMDKDDETVRGGGADDLGTFTITGRLTHRRRIIRFVKTYATAVGWRMTAHSVVYEGHIESDNRLAGTWTIDAAYGGFELTRQ